jgi:hypothetical protein
VSPSIGYCRALCLALGLFAMGSQFSGVRSEVETIGSKPPPRKSDCEIRIIDKTRDDQQENKGEARVEPKYTELARLKGVTRRLQTVPESGEVSPEKTALVFVVLKPAERKAR